MKKLISRSILFPPSFRILPVSLVTFLSVIAMCSCVSTPLPSNPASTATINLLTSPEATSNFVPNATTEPIISVTEYTISTQQCLHLMKNNNDNIILDLRKPHEYIIEHIKGATLAQDLTCFSTIEEASIQISNLEANIFVYGSSEEDRTAYINQLSIIGYTNVYSLGDITAWKGEFNRRFLNKPVSFETKKLIHEDAPEFTFLLDGKMVDIDNSHGFTMIEISKIQINCEPLDFSQVISVDENQMPFETNFNFELKDWNFDGYLDMSLKQYMGGSMGNDPSYYWLWDNNLGKFIENATLMEISQGCRIHITEDNQLVAKTSHGASGGMRYYYQYENNDFILLEEEFIPSQK